MNKFVLFLIGGIAALVFLANLGPMIGLAISILLLYLVFKQFLKANSTGGKIGWGILGLVILSATVSNVPAILGIVAVFILYFVYKKWNEAKVVEVKVEEDNDPFSNFEKQWSELNRN